MTVSDNYWLLHADGASLGNPGAGGAGAVIYDGDKVVLAEVSDYLGPKVTNNEAEYQGLLRGLRQALELGGRRIRIRLDSELVVRQILGIYKVKNARLAVFYEEIKELLGRFEEYEIEHVRRELNCAADALASKAARNPHSRQDA